MGGPMRAAWLWCILALFVRNAGASDEWIVTVMQPLSTSGAGNHLSAVTYVGFTLSSEDPAREILLTVKPNLIWCDGTPQDRNEAAREGIRFTVPETASPSDTLQVSVDLTSFAVDPRMPDRYYLELLTGTLWCGLRNARQRWPEIRCVTYRIEGRAAFQHYSGTYGLEKVPATEPSSQWLKSKPSALRP